MSFGIRFIFSYRATSTLTVQGSWGERSDQFPNHTQKNTTKTHSNIIKVYGTNIIEYETVWMLVGEFKEGKGGDKMSQELADYSNEKPIIQFNSLLLEED